MSISPLAEVLNNYKQLYLSVRAFFRQLTTDTIFFYLMLGAIIYYIVIFSAASILSQANFSTGAYDVGLYDQGIWLLSRFLAPFTTIKGVIIFGDHASFYSLFLVPWFWISASINWLYLFQTILLALTALPLFFYARQRLKSSGLALAVGSAYLLYPALQNMNLENFHPESAAVFFVAMALYFLLKGNFRFFYPLMFLAVIGKEDIGITFAFIGLYLLFYKKEKHHGTVTLLFGLGWYLLASRLIMPLCNGLNIFSSQPVAYSYWFQGLAANLFNPAYYWGNFTHPESLKYFYGLLLPLAFIPLLGFNVLILVGPALLINLIGGGYLRSIEYHYNYVIIAILFFALIEGLHYLDKKLVRADRRRRVVLVIAWLAVVLFGNSQLSHLPLNRHLTILRESYCRLSAEAVLTYGQALKLIPPAARVSASYALVPHLTHRREIYMFPNPFRTDYWNMWFREGLNEPPAKGHVDYLVIDRPNHGPEDQAIIRYLIATEQFSVIYDNFPTLALKKQILPNVPNQGAQDVIYEVKEGAVSINDDFPARLKIRSRGRISSLYFPASTYYLRTLMGDDLPVSRPLALEIFGYLFFPESGRYGLELQGNGQYLLELDGQPAGATKILSAGFHPYKLKYLNYGGVYELRLKLKPAHGPAYIIPDQYLRKTFDRTEFAAFLTQTRRERRELAEKIKNQPNLLKNGGFESIFGNFPKNWQLECWQDNKALCSYTVDSKIKKVGRFSAKIEQKGKADSRWVQEIELKPGVEYKLSGWIKVVDIAKEGMGAFIQLEGTNLRTVPLYGTNDWQYVEVKGRIGVNQKKVKAQCRLGDYGAPNIGLAYFDEISLIEVPKNDSGILFDPL